MSRTADATIVVPLLVQDDRWLRTCVASALDQTVRAEVIVVVSPRTPPSNLRVLAELGSHHPNLTVLSEAPRQGFAGAINRGFEAASTPRVGLLLSDDWLSPEALESCLPYDAHIVSTGTIVYDDPGTTVLEHRPLSGERFAACASLESKASYLEHFFLFDRAKVLDVGGVDEAIGVAGPDDYDLIWTLLEQGATVAIHPRPLYHYRDHSGMRLMLRDPSELTASLVRILDKHGVQAGDKQRLIREHSVWYGRPNHVTQAILAGIAGVNPSAASSHGEDDVSGSGAGEGSSA